MADFSFTPAATGIKPVQGMSLGEMMNTARGAQQYQQAEQVNPLTLQQQQQTTRTGEIALGVEEQKNKERQDMQSFFSNPNNFQTNGRIDIDKINAVVPKIAPLTGSDYITKYSSLGKAQTEAIGAKQNLTQDQRNMIAQRFSILGRLGTQDKNVYLNEMDLLKKENPDNPDLGRLVDSYKTIWQNSIESGPDLPGKAIAGAQTLMSTPQQQTSFAPTIATTAEGKTVTTTPSIGGQPPSSSVGVVGGMQPSSGPVAAGTEVAPGMRMPYPVRSASRPYMPEPTEVSDQTAGQVYRQRLLDAQSGLSQSIRNTEEVIKQATGIGADLFFPKGGVFGKLEQKALMALESDKYDLLAKDLANMALSNTKALGGVGNTVAGLDMQAVANGTIKVPTNVLINIARRVRADQKNLDMQTDGSLMFNSKFGDNNMRAFQQAWNANSKDSKIFEAINILENETNPDKLKTEFENLFPSEKKRKTILKQYKNLKSLSATGLTVDKLED